ncbi:MAG: peptide deformylase [Candidatus Brocadiia bacterium]
MEIKVYPERVLRKKCSPIERIDDEVVSEAQDMLEFMYESDGLGLAGPQVDWANQIVTLDVEQTGEGRRIFVNPRIIEREGHLEHEEGCLSLPGLRLTVPRAERVRVVAYTLDGERLEFDAEGLAACAWQHETDHLNGVLIIDRVQPTTLMTVRERLRRLERDYEMKAATEHG